MSLRCQIGYVLWVVVLIPVLIEGFNFFGNSKKYSVVIDAGTTTTNLLVLVVEKESGVLMLAEEDVWKTFTPGLLEYYDNPQAIKEYLKEILSAAEAIIPRGKWSNTQLVFRATAGFRFLSSVQENQILNEVRKILTDSHFERVFDYVSVLTKLEEGLYGWVAANLILDRLHGNPEDMVATVAIDEDSSHVTFPLTTDLIPQFAFEKRWVPVAGQHVNVYTNSNFRLGLGSVTVAILEMDKVRGEYRSDSPCVSSPDNGKTYHYNGKTYIIARCVSYADNGKAYHYNGNEYNIKSIENGVPIYADFLDCKFKIYEFMDLFILRKLDLLLNYQIHAISGFFAILRDAGVVDDTGGIISGNDIYNAGLDVCKRAGPQENPFLCLHITYIYVLLTERYGIPNSGDIYVSTKRNGHRINWATGLAYYNLEFKHAQ